MSRPEEQAGPHHAGLESFLRYPLVDAIAGRRTRRVARGTTLEAGALSHQSQNAPAPLSALEEAVLVVSTGLTGLTAHDVAFNKPGGPAEFGTPLMRVPARAASSPDNVQATHFILINDDGTWLLQHPRGGREGIAWLRELPPDRAAWRDADWMAAAGAMKRKLYNERLDFPRVWPYYFGWNKVLSNRPGTSVFMPMVDCTRQMINVLFILLSEPDGERPLVIDDWLKFRPRTLMESLAWIASKLGFVKPRITYHPVAGIERVRSKFLQSDHPVPLGLAATMRTDYEAHFHLQNLMLQAQALGLGGWIHAAVSAPFLFERDPAQGKFGLGFRMEEPQKKWRTWPPLPTTLPNPVGLDGILQGLCPPYVKSMNEAVDAVLEEKYGAAGAYGDLDVFARSYRDKSSAEAFRQAASRPSPKVVEYVRDICNYVWDTYGRFPAHVNAFHVPGVWVQVAHLELEYYDKYFDPSLYAWQARHDEVWGAH